MLACELSLLSVTPVEMFWPGSNCFWVDLLQFGSNNNSLPNGFLAIDPTHSNTLGLTPWTLLSKLREPCHKYSFKLRKLYPHNVLFSSFFWGVWGSACPNHVKGSTL